MTGAENDMVGEQTLLVRGFSPSVPAVEVGHFLALCEGAELRRVPVGPGGVMIGRQPPADLVIAAPEVSRRHCRIDVQGAWAVLTDLGSTNGTFVSGERIDRPRRLRNGTQIDLGSTTLRYEMRDKRAVADEAELAAELRRAADYVRAVLPQPINSGPVQAEWWFVPSAQLGGDAFGYQFIDEDHFAGFVLDVSGHGLGSAMHAVNAANALRRQALPGVNFREPAQVAAGLNAVLPMEEHNGLMLTMWYFVYNISEKLLRFCAAGHHPSFLVLPGAEDPLPLWLRSPAIGMLSTGKWAVGHARIEPGSRLYMFSDGAFEIVAANGQPWVLDDLRRIMREPEQPGVSESQRLYQAVRAAARPGPLDDDFSVLVLSFP